MYSSWSWRVAPRHCHQSVASGILPDVKGGFQPPGVKVGTEQIWLEDCRVAPESAGLEARFYSSQDGGRYGGSAQGAPGVVGRNGRINSNWLPPCS